MASKLGDPFLLILMLVALGPFLIVTGVENDIHSTIARDSELNHTEAVVGMFMVVFGLVSMVVKQVQLEKRLGEIERLKN